jgi:hypothetical protein
MRILDSMSHSSEKRENPKHVNKQKAIRSSTSRCVDEVVDQGPALRESLLLRPPRAAPFSL